MYRLRLGTRGSQLAIWQAELVARQIKHARSDLDVEIKIIKTKGDKILDVALSKIGDKGLFTREIEYELLEGNIDLAVHSMKDLPSVLTAGLCLGGVLPRENPQDVLISHKGYMLATLPYKAILGTSSLRRIAQLKTLRPDLNIVDMRGNVETRIKKMKEQDLDGIILAFAGVKRLGFDTDISELLSADVVLPAVGQGAIAIEIRNNDENICGIVNCINDDKTFSETMAERAFLAELEGGCQVPIASLATIKDNHIKLQGLVASLDGKRVIRDSLEGKTDNVQIIGQKLARRLLDQGAGVILDEIKKTNS